MLHPREELEPWVGRIRAMASKASTTYVVTNNHFQGKAVCNALEVKHMLSGKKIEVPPLLLARYPQLADVVIEGK